MSAESATAAGIRGTAHDEAEAIGICLGACTITIARRQGGQRVFSQIRHEGKVDEVLRQFLDTALPARVSITGRSFRNLITLPTLSEPEAVEHAYESLRHACPGVDCIVSAGGETFLAYFLDRNGRIRSVQTGNKCASGTGEFFLQQIQRMDLDLQDAVNLAVGEAPYSVAGRCSVFCKSDCTHALNKGLSKGRISAGLCKMMAGKISEILKKNRPKRILVVGGVSRNDVVLDFLRESYPETLTLPESPFFEALGALCEAERNGPLLTETASLFTPAHTSFTFLPGLNEALTRVTFNATARGPFRNGDYILGLDVGSTTTKAILLRTDTCAITAGVYLRTSGDPVAASRRCYRELLRQIPDDITLNIIGIGTTGSGRQIAGLHAQTPGVINEIVAHAAAAVFFDPEVETIFEIGGQDAKYTFITNRVASDYAMNEACSAGTGSFLEEACRETLGIITEEIEAIALCATSPPNFSDQCSAFISSDIKTAVQEGIAQEDIVAGLVYSVCQNYLNRVKGARPVGKKIFMQGGVCYNRAVPAAMASLCGQQIIVPPEPGLMGAFGVALEMKRKFETGIMEKATFNLQELADREVHYQEPFICGGGREKCDRKCSIARIEVNGSIYPFGGACDLHYNLLRNKTLDPKGLDLVKVREDLVFRKYAPQTAENEGARSVGIPVSLLTNNLYPFYATFFTHLGMRVVPGSTPDPQGMEAPGAAFCFPILLSHAFLQGLMQQEVDYIFIPQVKSLTLKTSDEANCTCPLVQAEPYFLQAAFFDSLGQKLLTEVLDFDNPERLRKAFISLARSLGFSRGKALQAFKQANSTFEAMCSEMHEIGRKFLAGLTPDESAIVLFGRPYNAFSKFGNMGIPHKFASRGYQVLPHDFLPLEELGGTSVSQMYWATGQGIMQAADFVQSQPNLFGVFVTNFSCGPDSFITGYFRDLMGRKPSLTLEVDAHTADAGIDTRIEAFLDIITGYRELEIPPEQPADFTPSRMILNSGKHILETGDGKRYRITDPRVHLVIPSMGDSTTQCLAAAFRHAGIRTTALAPPGPQELSLGKGHTTCKECLPLILTTGSLVKYLDEIRKEGEILAYLMPDTDGPCRFGQYNVFVKNFIRKNRIPDLALLTFSSSDSYDGLPAGLARRAWLGMAIGDGLEEVRAGILTIAADREEALTAFCRARTRIVRSIASDQYDVLMETLRAEMAGLASLKKRISLDEATRIALVGEIFVRRDGFSRQYLVESLADKGILVRTAPITEWLHYTDYCFREGLNGPISLKKKLGLMLKKFVMGKDERLIFRHLAISGFHDGHTVDMDHLMAKGAALINPELTGEAILTISSALTEIGDETHGVISIGPFGCMPCRIAESILSYRLEEEKANFSRLRGSYWTRNKEQLQLPFLAIESDGTPFSQLVKTRLESLILSANRLKEDLRNY
ncbi:MAG: acyl-CoA dehydratase activase [Geobacteraceae bacterium]